MRPFAAAQNTTLLKGHGSSGFGANRNSKMAKDQRERDLKLLACVDSFDWQGRDLSLRIDSLSHVTDTNARNVRRVASLTLFPPSSIYIAITIQRVVDRVEHENPKMPRQQRSVLVQKIVRQEMDQQRAIFERGDDDAKKLMKVQQETAFAIIQNIQPDFYDGPEAWMASQIIATWTAFESTAEDLWETALNLKPKILARLAGRKASRAHGTDDPKRIRLDSVYKYDFDIAKRMGTIFLEENRYAFDRLSGIREAYKDAFSIDGDEIMKIVDDKALDAISLVRNNLVHNGGVVDEQIVRRSSDLPPSLRALSVGEQILLDGEIVGSLIKPSILKGHDLIVAVDSWLSSH
jgi:hypothetical protein